jgi:hypothetical protein
MDPVVVVGAGISGVACARTLVAAGVPVVVLDRGRRVGGRMAVRTHEGRPVDTGASYLTASDPRFEEVVSDWHARGLARPWTDTFTVLSAGSPPRRTTGPMRWGAAGGLRSLVEDLARGLDVRQQEVAAVSLAPATERGAGSGPVVDGSPAGAVVLAMPDPQACRLLGPGLASESGALSRDFEPVLALTAAWAERDWDAGLQAAFVQGDDDVAFVADDGRRRGDGAPVLVAHSTPTLAARHLAAPDEALAPLLAGTRSLLGIGTEPRWAQVHRWSFARPAMPRDEPFLLSDNGIGACGDGWAAKPRVEGAYLSGVALGEALAARLTS